MKVFIFLIILFLHAHTQHDYDAIINWYKHEAESNPGIMKYIPSIGKSHEGRDMPAVLLTASKDPNRMKIYMQCQIHARELHIRTHFH